MMKGRNHLLMTHIQHLNKSFLISFQEVLLLNNQKAES